MGDAVRDEGESVEDQLTTRRRTMLAGLATMVAAAVAKLAPGEAKAQDGAPVILGETGGSTRETGIENFQSLPDGGPAFRVTSLNNWDPAVASASELGAGIVGAAGPAALGMTVTSTPSTFPPSGVLGFSDTGVGIRGVAGVAAFGGTATTTLAGDTGVLGVSAGHTGVMGVSGPQTLMGSATTTLATGVLGVSQVATPGVVGVSGPGALIGTASTTVSTGVLGLSELDAGVVGLSGPASLTATVSSTVAIPVGVVGASHLGYGVRGVTMDPLGVGVVAENRSDGVALEVMGRARFSTGGSGTLPIKERTLTVSDPRVTAQSHITVILTAEPRPRKLQVLHIVVQPGVGFVLHLNRRSKEATPFSYLILDKTTS